VRRLLAIAFRDRIRDLERSLERDVHLGPLKNDIVSAALERTFPADSVPSTAEDFAARVAQGRSRFNLIAHEITRAVSTVLAERAALEKKLAAIGKPFPQVAAEIREHAERLLARGWVACTPWERLQHFTRYLKAAALRADKLRADPQRDRRLAAEVAALEAPYRRELAARAGAVSAELEQFGWLLEELRVALFAQELRTPVPVSAKRLARVWHTVRR
jgi:ATP-dependent helicase HrpA